MLSLRLVCLRVDNMSRCLVCGQKIKRGSHRLAGGAVCEGCRSFLRLYKPTFILFMLVVFSSLATAVACPSGWSMQYVYGVNTSQSVDVLNYPALIAFNTSDATQWDMATNCSNVRFFDEAGVAADYDVVSPALCGNITNKLSYRVLLPNAKAGILNNITACVGNIGVASGENETSVWAKADGVSIYHFSELATAYDSRGYNNISMTNACTQELGLDGYAVNLTGTCYYSATAATNLPVGNANSTEIIWFKPQDLTPAYQGTFMYGDGNQGADTARSIYIGFGGAELVYTVYSNNYQSGLAPTQDIWQMAAINYNQTHKIVYRNATKASALTAAPLNTGAGKLAIGTSFVVPNDEYIGLLDEVQIYNVSKPDAYVYAMFQQSYVELANATGAPAVITVSLLSPANTTYQNASLAIGFNVSGGANTYSTWLSVDGGANVPLSNSTNATIAYHNISGLALGGHYLNITASNGSVNGTGGIAFSVSSYGLVSNNTPSIVYETNRTNITVGFVAIDTAISAGIRLIYNDSVEISGSCVNTSYTYNCSASRLMPLIETNNTALNYTVQINITVSGGTSYLANLTPFTQRILWAYIPEGITLPLTAYYISETAQANGSITNVLTAANRSYSFNIVLIGGAIYSTTAGAANGSALYQAYLTLPSSAGSYTVFGNYTLSFNGVSYSRNSSNSFNVDTYALAATNCSAGGYPVLLYTLIDEENASAVNGSQEITLTTYNLARTAQANFSFSNYSGVSLSICLTNNLPLLADSVHIYEADGYTTRYHYLLNASLNPASGVQVIPLYLLNNSLSTAVQFSVENSNGQNEGGVYIVAERYYPAENLYRAVAMGKANEQGDATIYLRILSPTYRYRVYKNFMLAKTTTNALIGCTVAPCSITIVLGTGELVDYLTWTASIGHACVYDNTTYVLNCTFADSSQVAHNFRLLVEQSTALRTSTVCDVSVITQSGSLVCTGLNASNRYVYSLTFSSSPLNILEAGVIVQSFLHDLGAFGRFIGLLVFVGIAAMGILIADVFIAGIFAGVGLLALMILGLVPFSEAAIAGLVLFGIILAMKGASSKGG